MNIAGREIGNQILYDMVVGDRYYPVSGGSAHSQNTKDSNLEKLLDSHSASQLNEIHNNISEYVKFIETEPEASKENYDHQQKMINIIGDFAHPIIQKNEMGETHVDHLHNKIKRIRKKLPQKSDDVQVITPYQNDLLLVTKQGEVYDLNTGDYNSKLTKKISDSTITKVVGATEVRNRQKNHFFVVGEQGAYTSDSTRLLEDLNTHGKNLGLHAPYNELITVGSLPSVSDMYLRNKSGEIVEIKSGEMKNTPYLEAIESNTKFTFKDNTYEFINFNHSINNSIRLVNDEKVPEYTHTEHYQKYLTKLT